MMIMVNSYMWPEDEVKSYAVCLSMVCLVLSHTRFWISINTDHVFLQSICLFFCAAYLSQNLFQVVQLMGAEKAKTYLIGSSMDLGCL